jgi:tRNA(Ile)-lysidine synthase
VRQRLHLPTPTQTVLRNFSVSDPFLIGVSGGRDSVTLLDWLVRAGYHNLIVCHLNHQLRGRSSDADARFVEKLVTKYKSKIVTGESSSPEFKIGKRSARPTTAGCNLDLVIDSTDVRALASKKKMSIETAAREARYAFFARVAKRKKYRTILLAHHADDLVETFLINLFRGAGGAGLVGMRESSQHHVNGFSLQIVRPLLGVWRTDIDKYIRHHRLPFREDASNAELGPLRNRIRHRVLPYLERSVGRQIRQNIWRTAMIFSDEETFFSELLPQVPVGVTELALEALRKMSVALQRRTLHQWLRSAKVSDVGFEVIERIRGLLDIATGSARTNLSKNRHVRRRAGKLILE